MRVLLADDNRLMLEGLQNLMEAHGIEVAGTAADGQEAVARARELKPDIILMDICMPRCDGLTATRLIKAEMPDARIVVLTTSAEDNDLFEAVKSGACGYLIKSINTEELIEALEQAQHGVPPFSPGLAARLLAEFGRLARQAPGESEATPAESEARPGHGLTPRHIQVLELVSRGQSYKEVGARLRLSSRTVKYHMAEIMARLHLENRAQVLAYAGRCGLIGNATRDK
ncbi:MAG: response regulator transcription factor [Acidobacteria bacterium]|nr:response regulator transcription factor [Acidobacteriota bacterium]